MTPTPPAPQTIAPKISSTAAVYAAVCEIHANEMPVNRETVAELTGLPLTTVDDRIKYLHDEGSIRRTVRSHYVPADTFPVARAITKTTLPDGMVKLEVGDYCLELTPTEARRLANAFAGERENHDVTITVRNAVILNSELAQKIEHLSRQIRALEAKQDQRQGNLMLEGN